MEATINKTTLEFEHKEQTNFFWQTKLKRTDVKSVNRSCGCSDARYDEATETLSLSIKADKFPKVVDNVPTPAYKGGKRDYTKTVSVTVTYNNKEVDTWKFNINVSE